MRKHPVKPLLSTDYALLMKIQKPCGMLTTNKIKSPKEIPIKGLGYFVFNLDKAMMIALALFNLLAEPRILAEMS